MDDKNSTVLVYACVSAIVDFFKVYMNQVNFCFTVLD